VPTGVYKKANLATDRTAQMQIVGFPPKFWVVTESTPNSTLGDFCFECDFRGFALQVRGGLEVDSIQAVFEEQEDAMAFARSLVGDGKEDMRLHRSPFASWYATQESPNGVVLHDKDSDQQTEVRPPSHWGRHWAWNVDEYGSGILMRRTSLNAASATPAAVDLQGADKARIFYVATVSRYVLVEAFNAEAALKAGERHPQLNGGEVLTVRVATPDEIDLSEWHKAKSAEERRASEA
jgi:hypothetical protein